jgi:hypothetical protein
MSIIDKKRFQARHVMQDYRNRDYCQHMLDERIFDELNDGETDALALMTTGCLDAMDHIPAGAMRGEGRYYDQAMTVRGLSYQDLLDREELASRLILEILNES